MVVRLDLHQRVGGLHMRCVPAIGSGIEARDLSSLHHRRVVGVSDDGALRVRRMRMTDHREQASLLRDAVDDPARVEDLVPAMLGVRLREHHEFDIGRIAAHPAKALDQIVDFVRSQCKAQGHVRAHDGLATFGQQRNRDEWLRREMREQRVRIVEARQYGFGHPVVNERQQRRAIRVVEGVVADGLHPIRDSALDPPHGREPAVMRDVRRLRRPRRKCAGTRNDDEEFAALRGPVMRTRIPCTCRLRIARCSRTSIL